MIVPGSSAIPGELCEPCAAPYSGMRRIQFVTAGFNPKNPGIYGPYLKSLVEALTEIDLAYLRAHPETPKLYLSGVVYERQPVGCEWWRDVAACLEAGAGDCKCLAAWLAAEFRLAGHAARPIVSFKSVKKSSSSTLTVYHVLVRVGDEVHDPSLALGMSENRTRREITPWIQLR